MGVLYEHWRPDLNECFYVGVSWAAEKSRPYAMKNRNINHLKIQKELAAKGLQPEIRLVECSHLSFTELEQFETLQIAYWRNLIGNRLVNLLPGGNCFTSALGKIIQNRPEVLEKNRAAQKIVSSRPDVIQRRVEGSKKTRKARTPERIEEVRLSYQKAQNDPLTKAKRKETDSLPEVRAKRSAAQQNPETNKKRSANIKKALSSMTQEEKDRLFEKRSRAQKIAKNDPEYKRKNVETQKIIQLEVQNRPEVKAKKSASLILVASKRTPEQRSAMTKKGWETRRRNALKDK
jgi:hypothetical protein